MVMRAKTALFSFEGTNLRAPPSNKAGGEFLENCIEKNFHVSSTTHEAASFDRVQEDTVVLFLGWHGHFCALPARGCNFALVN